MRDDPERDVCERGHARRKQQTHVVGVKQRLPVPKGWPLDSGGYLMCSTCHEPHLASGAADAKEKEKEGPRRRSLLRSEKKGALLCEECHAGLAKGDSRSWHILVAESAHGNEPESAAASQGRLDALSKRCLSCHDGTTAFDQLNNGPGPGASSPGSRQGWTFSVDNTLARAGVAHLGQDLRNDPPVSVKYDPIATGGLHPARSGSVGGLPLYGTARDQIECTSCHDPHESRFGSFLRATNSGSAMCKTCHRK